MVNNFFYKFTVHQSESKTEGQKYSVEAVDKAIKRVKQGIFALSSDKKPEMWKSYINFMKKMSETDPKLVSYLKFCGRKCVVFYELKGIYFILLIFSY